MATPEQYAQWIVANKDKRGTPEFETVARAYQASRGQRRPQRTLDDYKAMSAPGPAVDPTEGMSGAQKFTAGMGMGMARLGRGFGQAVGLVDQSEIDQARELEAPLEATTGGSAGNVVGTIAGLAPLALVPGANTLAGAAALGAGSGALATEGGLKDRGAAALGGLVGGAGGIAAGRAVGAGLGALGNRAARIGAERSVTNQSIRAAREAGYRLPPSEMAQTGLGRFGARAAESMGGKAATAHTAQRTNQEVTNRLVRRDLGLGGNGQISRQDLDAAMRPHLAVYAEASRVSPQAAASLRAWRDSNDLVRRHLREYNANYTVAAEDAAIAARNQANQHLAEVEREAAAIGNAGLAERLARARVELGRIGTVENAINEGTGNVSAVELAKALDRGVPLNGGMERAARFAQAFPDFARTPKSLPGVSKLDAWTAGIGVAGSPLTGGASLGVAALPVVSYGARNALLSRPMQALASPSANPGAMRAEIANALANPRVRAALASAGMSTNALAQQRE